MASSSTSAMLAALPEVADPLRIEWTQVPLLQGGDSSDRALTVKNPKTALQNYFPGAEPNWTDSSVVSAAEFFNTAQEQILNYVQAEIHKAHGALVLVENRRDAENAVHKAATEFLSQQVSALQQELTTILAKQQDKDDLQQKLKG